MTSRRVDDATWNKHSFYCEDEVWRAAGAVTRERDSNLSREIRAFLDKLAAHLV